MSRDKQHAAKVMIVYLTGNDCTLWLKWEGLPPTAPVTSLAVAARFRFRYSAQRGSGERLHHHQIPAYHEAKDGLVFIVDLHGH